MKKILIVENSPTIISVADSLLRQHGYDVTCLSEGLKAVEYARAERPDLILSGLGLPDMNGLQFCKKISEDSLAGGIPIVLFVGEKDSSFLDKIDLCGARGRINKPFSPKELLSVVAKFVGDNRVKQPPAPVDQTSGDAPKYKSKVSPQEIGTATRSIIDKNLPGAETGRPAKHETVFNLDWEDLKGNDKTTHKPAQTETDDSGLILEEDQFGLTSLADEVTPVAQKNREEDYEWFVQSMQEEGDDSKLDSALTTPQKTQQKPADMVPQIPASKDDAKYRHFLEQFKKEADVLSNDKPTTSPTPDLDRLADNIAGKLAQKIVDKLDRQELKQIITSILDEKS